MLVKGEKMQAGKYRRALMSDYLCLMLCAFTVFMLMYSCATLTEDPYDGSFVYAEEIDEPKTDLQIHEPVCTHIVYDQPADDDDGDAVKKLRT